MIETEISSLEIGLKTAEQQTKFDENLEFQEAVNKQIEKRIENIRNDLILMENKFNNVTVDIKADARRYQCRKKRIVIFGMPNTYNDLDTVQKLFEELELGKLKLKRYLE